MPVFRTEKTSDYAVIAKHHLKNRALSYKAKGLMTFMLSVPPDWDWSMAGLSTLASDGVDGVRSGIRELEKHGYLTRRRIRDAAGKLGDIEYTIHEIPKPPLIPIDDESGAPVQANPALGSPMLEKPTLAEPILPEPTLDLPTQDKPTQVLPTQENPMQCINNLLSIESALNNKELSNKTHKHNPPAADVCAGDSGQLTLDDAAYPRSNQQPNSYQHTHSHQQQAECLTIQMAQGADKSSVALPKAKPAQAPPDFFPVPANHTMTLVENENEPKCEHDKQFDLFWQLYPRKASKKAARKAWADIKPDDALFSAIMTALNAAVRYWQNQGVSLKHIPHPSTWLNEERWEDEFPFPAAQPTGFDGGSHAVKYSAKHTTKQQGGGQIAANGADYTIGGDNDPYRGLMQ